MPPTTRTVPRLFLLAALVLTLLLARMPEAAAKPGTGGGAVAT
jgi:hypothetical protein